MLKYRLIFGTLMTILFVSLMLFDGWLDGSLTAEMPDKAPQGTILTLLIALLAVPANLELARLTSAKNFKMLTPVTIAASMVIATVFYWIQFFETADLTAITSVLIALTICCLFLYQSGRYALDNVVANMAVSSFAVIYLGILSSFIPAIRIQYGLWHLLMVIFVVKCSDIGAYTAGKLFGKHKFSPVISPKKTWEGMAGAVLAAIIVAVLFALICDIMFWWKAIMFGVCFAFIGQLGDLAESMIKRDMQTKDSASTVPGFGGILDVIDSPLVAAVFAYLFFVVSCK